MENKIKTLQKSYDGLPESLASYQAQVDSLAEQVERLETALRFGQQKVIQLESKLENPKYALSGCESSEQPLESSKTIHQDYTLEGKKAPYLTQNDPKRSSAVLSEIRDPTSRGNDIQSKTVSEDPRSPFKTLTNTQYYNIPSNEEKKGPNDQNFITLSKISEEERVEIIKPEAKRRVNNVNRISTQSTRSDDLLC